jgi:hypothetical protein
VSSPPTSPSAARRSHDRPAKTSPTTGLDLAPTRQPIESIIWICKDLLTLERHGARTLPDPRKRILARLWCLAATITVNHQLERRSRAPVNYCA